MITKINEFKKINENKIKPINEGQFSWYTQDTNQQIGSEEQNTITVYMYDNKGNVYKESNYEGYGVFGGKDYYDIMALMNGYTKQDIKPGSDLRQLGIDIAFDKLPTKNKDGKKLYPALVSSANYDITKHDFTKEPENDPNQSWFTEEYDEDDYNMYEKYNLGDKWSVDFDYEDMLNTALNITEKTPIEDLIKLYNSMVDVNYHTLAKLLNNIIEYIKIKQNTNLVITKFKNEVRKELLEINEKKKMSKSAKEFISKKIKVLMDEGKPQKQAIAIAYSMAKEDGLLTELKQSIKVTTPDSFELENRLEKIPGIFAVDAQTVTKAIIRYNDKKLSAEDVMKLVDKENKTINENKTFTVSSLLKIYVVVLNNKAIAMWKDEDDAKRAQNRNPGSIIKNINVDRKKWNDNKITLDNILTNNESNLNAQPEEDLYHDIDWKVLEKEMMKWFKEQTKSPLNFDTFVKTFGKMKNEIIKYKMLN